MTNVLSDGFDSVNSTFASPGGLGDKWMAGPNGSGTTRIDIVTGRGGVGRAVRLRNSGGGGSITGATRSAVSAFTLNFDFKIALNGGLLGNDTYNYIHFMSSGTFCLGLGFRTDGSINLNRTNSAVQGNGGATLQQSGPNSWLPDVWYGAQLEATIHDTTGRFALYVDDHNTALLSGTNVDTKNSTVTAINQVRLGHDINTTLDITVDNLWMSDSDTRPANFLRCETKMPNADGGTLNFTPSTGTDHFAVVDEAQVNVADYLSGSNVGDFDELQLENLLTTPQFIEDIVHFTHAAKTDAAAREIALGILSGATNSDGGNYALNSTGSRIERSMLTDPDTAAAWSAAAANALRLRPKITV